MGKYCGPFSQVSPVIISCLTMVQYKGQEMDTGVIHKAYSGFTSYTGVLSVCVCICMHWMYKCRSMQFSHMQFHEINTTKMLTVLSSQDSFLLLLYSCTHPFTPSLTTSHHLSLLDLDNFHIA